MKITIKGSPKELAELAKALGGAGNEVKKTDLPPLLTELVKNRAPKERTFSDFKPHFQAALDKFCGDDKINELAEAVRNAGKENAPQEEAAEQSDEVGIAKQSINNLRKMISEKTAEFFDEYVNAVSNATDDHATFNHCFYLRKSAYEMWKMLSKSVIANIWDCDTLFL